MIELSDKDLLEAIDLGDFSPTVLESKKRVAVIMTQGWCPQWKMMKRWLAKIDEDINTYWVEYDRRDLYENFMTFKESQFKNGLVPYIRFYVDGKFVGESNYCNQESFLDFLGL